MAGASSGRKEVEGRVRQVLPRALYRVAVGDGQDVIAHAGPSPGRNFVRLVEGDRVMVAIATADGGRGRIVKKVRSVR